MLVIRLARTGRRNQPKFRVAVAEHSKPVNGKVVEVVGHFNPTVKKDPLVINKEAIESWLAKGAQPSNTISRLLNEHAGFSLDVKQRPPRKPKAELKKAVEGEAPVTEEKPADKPEAQPVSDDLGKPAIADEAKEGKPKQEKAPKEKSTDKPETQPTETQGAKEGEPKDESAPSEEGSDKKSE